MRPTLAEIDLSAISFNLKGIKAKVHPAGIMAVVKANAYGHGDIEICKAVINSGVDYLGVACVEEGIALREAGINAPVLVFSSAGLNRTDLYIQYDLEATIFDEPGLKNIRQSAEKLGKEAVVQIKVDTGMGRMGINWRQAIDYITKVDQTPHVKIQGIYTHFAASDHLDKSFALLQLERFNQVLEELKEKEIDIPLKHAANSGAILDLPEAYFNIVRPGITMYGYYPSSQTSESIPLKSAMTFKTRVVYIKEIEKGESVSYDRIFIAPKKTLIASLPVGYGDGYNRLLSGTGEVLIRGKRFPVVGRVCMDLIMVDLGDDYEIKIGDEAVLFGAQGNDRITVNSISEKCNTIPYEIICWISPRVPRIYLNKEE